MKYYLDNVLNPEDLSGLTKKFKIQIKESSDYFRSAEIHVLALDKDEAKAFVYDNLYDYDQDIDWDSNTDNADLDVDEIEEVKE